MRIVGYTHSGGYALCTDCENGSAIDTCNESGYVQPIFDTQGEYDSYPMCDVCQCEIDGVTLTSDGREWLHESGRKESWESWNDAFRSVGSDFYMAYRNGDNWYCLDCFISDVLGSYKALIAVFYRDMKNDDIFHNIHVFGVISETTVQYEQWPGETIPLEGIKCSGCSEELYPAMDVEEYEYYMGELIPEE